jgi:hypothetical protein
MRLKWFVLLAAALAAFAIAVPAAQTAPTSPNGCPVEHLTGAECQGPDADAAANACDINTWVDNASCVLTVPDGVASGASVATIAHAELQPDAIWHGEVHVVIRDQSSGQVLFAQDATNTVPVAEHPQLPAASIGIGTTFAQTGGGQVVCEVTGTHSHVGAAMSTVAATTGAGLFNNTLECAVN